MVGCLVFWLVSALQPPSQPFLVQPHNHPLSGHSFIFQLKRLLWEGGGRMWCQGEEEKQGERKDCREWVIRTKHRTRWWRLQKEWILEIQWWYGIVRYGGGEIGGSSTSQVGKCSSSISPSISLFISFLISLYVFFISFLNSYCRFLFS